MMEKLLGILENDARKPGFEGVYALAWSNNPEMRDELMEKMKKRLDMKSLVIGRISPVVGAHTGPGALGVFCY